jgi:hypothetical protein
VGSGFQPDRARVAPVSDARHHTGGDLTANHVGPPEEGGPHKGRQAKRPETIAGSGLADNSLLPTPKARRSRERGESRRNNLARALFPAQVRTHALGVGSWELIPPVPHGLIESCARHRSGARDGACQSRRVLATLIRLLGDFDLAEEALHDAFAPRSSSGRGTACRPTRAPGWSRPGASRPSTRCGGAPASTRSTNAGPPKIPVVDAAAWADDESVEDDRLRLIFTCCHPALSPDAQVALTLREVCGLTTEEIAQAFLTPAHAGAAHRARQGEDPRRAHPVRGAGAGRAARAPRRGAAGDLPGVQRGLRGVGSGESLTRHDLSSKRSGWAGCSSSCCPSPRRSGCSR